MGQYLGVNIDLWGKCFSTRVARNVFFVVVVGDRRQTSQFWADFYKGRYLKKKNILQKQNQPKKLARRDTSFPALRVAFLPG